MTSDEWNDVWDLLVGAFPAVGGLSQAAAAKAVWFAAFRGYPAGQVAAGVRRLSQEQARPTIVDLLDAVAEMTAPAARLTTPQPSEERSAETYAERLERAAANYEATFQAAQAQLVHEQGCPSCREYAQPAGDQDHHGEPCAVGKRFHAPYARLNGGRWNTPKEEVRHKSRSWSTSR